MSNNTKKQTDQVAYEPPTLSDLVGFDVPKLRMHFPSPNEMVYILDGTTDDLAHLKRAASNASDLLADGIEAVVNLLLTVDLCECEFAFQSRISALALILELSKIARVTREMEWRLDHTTQTNDPI